MDKAVASPLLKIIHVLMEVLLIAALNARWYFHDKEIKGFIDRDIHAWTGWTYVFIYSDVADLQVNTVCKPMRISCLVYQINKVLTIFSEFAGWL